MGSAEVRVTWKGGADAKHRPLVNGSAYSLVILRLAIDLNDRQRIFPSYIIVVRARDETAHRMRIR